MPYRLAKPQYLLTRKVCKITFEKLKDGTRGSPSRRVRRRASPHEGNNKMKDFLSSEKVCKIEIFFSTFSASKPKIVILSDQISASFRTESPHAL